MTQSIKRYLGSGDALARLQDHAGRLRRLQITLERGLPPLLSGLCRVANLKDETLVIAASGGAAAARLKQMVPGLIAHFLQAGHPLKDIRIRVASPEPQEVPRAPPLRHISPNAKADLTRFAASLPADDPLRSALERLAQRSRE